MKFMRSIAALLSLSLALIALPALGAGTIPSGGPFDNWRNLLDNGAFNFAQRTTTSVTGVNTTPTYLWDRWAGYANAGGASLSLVNGTSSLPTPFTNAARVQRASSNSSTQLICLVQEVASNRVIPLRGQPVAISAWMNAGANFSAASSIVSMRLVTGTAADEGLAALLSGWTGAATSSFSQAISSTWGRYVFTAPVPSDASEAAVELCYTPVGTAGTNDYFQATGIQAEFGTVASNFEWRSPAVEILLLQQYFYRLNEAANLVPMPGYCQATGATAGSCVIPLPVVMRTAPTINFTAGSIKVNIAGTPTSLATPTFSTPTTRTLFFTIQNTNTAGQLELIQGGGGSGIIQAEANF